MKIVVAVPTYDGKIPVDVVTAMLNEKTVAMGIGDDIVFEFLPGCSHPAMGRNQLADSFLKSGFDRLVFLDADVTFEPGSLVKLAHYPHDFVGGAYRFKMTQENYPVGFIDLEKGFWSDKFGTCEVASVPGGFLSLSRNVFEKIKASNPNKTFEHMGKTLYCYFEMPYRNGHLCGEDSFFCESWRALGEKVYLDMNLSLTHWDYKPTPYHGHVGKWLLSQNKESA